MTVPERETLGNFKYPIKKTLHLESKRYFVYLLTNPRNTVIYTGITNDLERRMYEHKEKLNPNSFSAKYNLSKLVYYEEFEDVNEAIGREKQIKAGSRQKKMDLIESGNEFWIDLFDELFET